MKRIEIIIPHSSMLRVINAIQSLGVHFTHYETKGKESPNNCSRI